MESALGGRREVTRRMVLGGVLCAAVSGCTTAGPVRHTSPAKLDSRMARDVRRADVLGLTPTASLSAGPISIGDLAQALTPLDGEAPPPGGQESRATQDADREYRAVLEVRYAREIDDRWNEAGEHSSFFAPFKEARLRTVWVDDPVRVYNEQGREFNGGFNFYASNRFVARLWNHLVLTAEPEFAYVENDTNPTDSEDIVLRAQELHGSVRFGGTEITVGRMPLWWGPSRHGSLLLSNNARPLDMVRLSTGGPVLLPGFLAHLGLIRGEVFASRLESSRAVKRPYFAGMRLSSRILPYLELGASRTAQFGGGDRSVTPKTIWKVFTAETENDEDDPGNQIASIDARVIIPWSVQPFEVYGEYGGEDEAGGFFSAEAVVAGIYLPRIGSWSWIEWTFEVADNTISDGRAWYTNRNYPDGYTYHERIIGHHMGTDARDIFTEVRVRLREDVTTFVSYDYEEHFVTDAVVERLHQIRVGGEFRPWRRLVVSAFVGIDEWTNFEQRRGDSRTGFVTGVGVQWRF